MGGDVRLLQPLAHPHPHPAPLPRPLPDPMDNQQTKAGSFSHDFLPKICFYKGFKYKTAYFAQDEMLLFILEHHQVFCGHNLLNFQIFDMV
jgi:hypothetical protein